MLREPTVQQQSILTIVAGGYLTISPAVDSQSHNADVYLYCTVLVVTRQQPQKWRIAATSRFLVAENRLPVSNSLATPGALAALSQWPDIPFGTRCERCNRILSQHERLDHTGGPLPTFDVSAFLYPTFT